MTKINIRTLAGAWLDHSAVVFVYPNRTLTDGEKVAFPFDDTGVVIYGAGGFLEIPAPDPTFCWVIEVLPVGHERGKGFKRYVTFPDVESIDWEDLVEVDPDTFVPLTPLPPTAAEILAVATTSAAAAAGSASEASTAADVAVRVVRDLDGITGAIVLTLADYLARKAAGTILPGVIYLTKD